MNKVKHVRTLSNNKGWIHWFETSTAYHLHKRLVIKYFEAFFLFEVAEGTIKTVEKPFSSVITQQGKLFGEKIN